MEIPRKLKDEIWEYCRLNDITDIDAFILNSTQQGFNIEKYGTTPFKIGGEPEIVEKEVVKVVTATTEVEIIKEVPIEIEVIKEVEKIREPEEPEMFTEAERLPSMTTLPPTGSKVISPSTLNVRSAAVALSSDVVIVVAPWVVV